MVQLIPELPHLRRFARSLTRDQAAADDLVQSTAEKALKNHTGFLGRGSYRSWLFTILFRLFLDEKNHLKKLQETPLEEVENHSASNNMYERAELRQITLLLQQLPEEQRITLILITVEGFIYEEVAKMMNVPLGTVMSRLHRARRKLKDLIDENKAFKFKTGKLEILK